MGVGGRSGLPKRYQKELKRWFIYVIGFIVYLVVATLFNLGSMWCWVWEPMGFMCKHPPLTANNSGVKVLIYAPPKSGTTATAKFLLRLYPHAYHSEDFHIHIWSQLSDMFWQRPENGGSIWPWRRLATPSYPAYKGFSFRDKRGGPDAADTRVLKGLGDELRPILADRLSRCRVDAMAFDGFMEAFWPIYDVSPDAKIVMLNWRTFEEWSQSGVDWNTYTFLALTLANIVSSGQHVLPWNAVVVPLWDALTGNKITERLRDGKPWARDPDVSSLLFTTAVMERRFLQHWYSGFGGGIPWNAPDRANNTNIPSTHIGSKAAFKDFWNHAHQYIPKERILELDLRKSTPMDLCRFLGKEDNPACELKKIPKHRPSLISAGDDSDFLYLVPHYLAIQFVNLKLISLFLLWFRGVLLRAVGGLGLSLATKKKKKAA
eukprot:CAMPEP_0204511302 /NCGR_PEP_ID=MMETSP0661-20131031/351_1 /ASSEMBLY_ACC=CAM_ASM_000606 /TAXON_ID=109239 /ORGANISM="Alexandrium margalefi, Strain AMGDE01CS-322" /LENGTH=432 /DNA_ID=CAMNT_0051516381 /DNA_START=77 /DNA_END=1375 /DNA_ORIENTATION=+